MGRARETDDSVYDFLYIDLHRITLFHSQFSQYGSLTGLTRAVSESSATSGGLSAVVKVDAASSQQTTQTSQYDAQWIAPLSFLDEANRRGMIGRDLSHARIGHLVLVSGDLSLFDLGLIKSAWGLAPIKTMLHNAFSASTTASPPPNRQERRRQDRDGGRDDTASASHEAGLEMLKFLPHATIAAIREGSRNIWATLKEDSLVVSASDLLLKHGVRITGLWNMVGILDAMPEAEAGTEQDAVADLIAATSLGSLGEVVGQMAPAIRAMLGRPADAYGMTPLVVFREVAA